MNATRHAHPGTETVDTDDRGNGRRARRGTVLALGLLSVLALVGSASPAAAEPTGDVRQGPCTYWTAPMYKIGSAITANVYVRCTSAATLNDVVEVIKRDVNVGFDPEGGRGHRYNLYVRANTTYNLGPIARATCSGGVWYAKVAMKVNGTWGDWYEGTHYRC